MTKRFGYPSADLDRIPAAAIATAGVSLPRPSLLTAGRRRAR
jgi:hypothetical protein